MSFCYADKVKEHIIKLLEQGKMPYDLSKGELSYKDVADTLNVSIKFVKNVINDYDEFYIGVK